MNKYQEKLLETIDFLISDAKKQLPFNSTIEAKIVSELAYPKYEIQYQNEIYTAKALNSTTFLPNDLVYILILNNNFSNKVILSKIP